MEACQLTIQLTELNGEAVLEKCRIKLIEPPMPEGLQTLP